jgi:hypothetical protein
LLSFPSLSSSHISLALFAPVAIAQGLWSVCLVPATFWHGPKGGGAGQEFRIGDSAVRPAGASWACLPDRTVSIGARYARICLSRLSQWVSGLYAPGTDVEQVQEAMYAMGFRLFHFHRLRRRPPPVHFGHGESVSACSSGGYHHPERAFGVHGRSESAEIAHFRRHSDRRARAHGWMTRWAAGE